jgi:hypothetical protein
MDLDMIPTREFIQPVGIGGEILVRGKTGLAVIAALNDVLGNTR